MIIFEDINIAPIKMNQSISIRIQTLQEWLKREKLEAIIIPTADPHISEYLAPHWKVREWISGFTGSAGTIIVTLREAGLWTDSRYFLQATQQLTGSGITLYKEGLLGTPTITEFLSSKLNSGDRVGIDGKLFSINQVNGIKDGLSHRNIKLEIISDPMDKLWENRPLIPETEIFIYPLKYAGKSSQGKITLVREQLKQVGSNGIIISALDEIAWILNIRGEDIHCNPVAICYLVITLEHTHLFINPVKVSTELKKYLKSIEVEQHEYSEIEDFLRQISIKSISVDPAKTNYSIASSINSLSQIQLTSSPVGLLKAIRNEQEIQGIHTAMLRDGIALVKFLKWLEEEFPQGNVSEMTVDKKLHSFRSQQDLFIGDSFDTIAGYKEHAAIVHYEATPETDSLLKKSGFLLLDSGAQYLDGTTDITRTIALGELTEEEKMDYTLILKGHIALAMAVFPTGTRGAQLDVLARMPIWQKKMNYLHGTGHGVGHFLNVHEGPQSIRMNENPIPLQIGMVTSNEPGLYKAGKHGIRTENLTLVVSAGEGMFGEYLKFETLTLCPICKKGIIKELLTNEEVEWFNNYHQKVYDKLAPKLEKEEQEWLRNRTSKL